MIFEPRFLASKPGFFFKAGVWKRRRNPVFKAKTGFQEVRPGPLR
jgi:hypothetical protein